MSISIEISNLRLCSAFKDLACDILSCIEVDNSSHVYIVDDTEHKYSCFIKSDEVVLDCFCGININNYNLHFTTVH